MTQWKGRAGPATGAWLGQGFIVKDCAQIPVRGIAIGCCQVAPVDRAPERLFGSTWKGGKCAQRDLG